MALLTWSDAQNSGIDATDAEHRGLFDAINALDAAMGSDQERQVVAPLLDRVAEKTRSHFASEEAVMAYAHYPGSALHALKHKLLLDQISAFVARFERGGSTLNQHSLNFLRDWCITHLEKDDKQFGQWLNEHSQS